MVITIYNVQPHTTYFKANTKRTTLIDHIISNNPNRIIHEDVLPTDDISDHETQYILLNIKKERFATEVYIRDEKNCNMDAFIKDFYDASFKCRVHV